jgi:lysophospholipase L1-like esterase
MRRGLCLSEALLVLRTLLFVLLALLAQACSARSEDLRTRQSALGLTSLPSTVAWYGDSITEGSCKQQAPPAALAQLLGSSWFVSNHGVSGEAAEQIRQRYEASWDSACQGQACGWYLIQGGVNSLKGVPHTSPAHALADMVAMVDSARDRGRRVVWFEILPFKGCTLCDDTTPGVARVREYNALMAQACAARPEVACVQVYSDFEDPVRPDFLRPDYGCDGIHLNEAGAEQLAGQARGLFPP